MSKRFMISAALLVAGVAFVNTSAISADYCTGVKEGTCAEFKAVLASVGVRGTQNGSDARSTDPDSNIRAGLARDNFASGQNGS